MKRVGILSIVALLAISTLGCACYSPGYGLRNQCGSNYGCSQVGRVVDYVDGPPCGGVAACGESCYTDCSPCTSSCSCGRSDCQSCLNCIENGIRVVGRGILTVAAAPFVIAGQIICGGCGGYETYPNCGCSNEVYYGDNCYQNHDFCEPCADVDPCGCGGSVATSGCNRCSGGYVEGIQYENDADSGAVNGASYFKANPQTQRVQTVRNGRPVTLRQPVQVTQNSANQVQRLNAPPRPVVASGSQQNVK